MSFAPQASYHSWMCRYLFLLCLLLPLEASLAEGDDRLPVQLEIVGVDGDQRRNINAHLSLRRQAEHGPMLESRVRRLHARAPEEIRRALEPLGYYQSEVDASLERGPEAWLARYEVTPGEPVRVRAMEVVLEGEAGDDGEFLDLVERLPLQEGDVLHHGRYESSKRQLSQLAAERGYFDARVADGRIRVDPEGGTADVTIRFDSGRRYAFGEVTYNQDILRDQLFVRFEPFEPGDSFRQRELVMLQNELTDSGYFSRVEIDVRHEDAENGRVPIHINLTPRPSQRYALGIGYGTDTGPRLSLGMELRRLNRHGHRLGSELGISEIRRSLATRYEMPRARRTAETYVLRSRLLEDESGDRDTQSIAVGGNRIRPIRGWTEDISLDYLYEDYDIGIESGRSRLLYPGIAYTRARADDVLRPRRGDRVRVELRGAAETLFSETNMVQVELGLRSIRPVGEASRLLFRFDGAYTEVEDFSLLPPSLRFFAGGDNSVRGFAYRRLGPTDAEGNVIGGRHLLVASAEYEQHVVGNWSSAVFYDVGNALRNMEAVRDDLEQGAGFGARWHSPVGTFRVDLANAVSRSGNRWRLHIHFGVDL